MAQVPDALRKSLAGRDDSPLPKDALVRYQYISLGKGIAGNLRALVMEDGRLFAAASTGPAAPKPGALFDSELPAEPNRTLSEDELEAIHKQFDATGFFEEDPYVDGGATRDGYLAIVTARREGRREHEVWYSNWDNELTDLLYNLATADQEQESLGDILEDLMTQNSRLNDA